VTSVLRGLFCEELKYYSTVTVCVCQVLGVGHVKAGYFSRFVGMFARKRERERVYAGMCVCEKVLRTVSLLCTVHLH